MHYFASIPSPGSNAIHLGSLQLRAYGLMIALGVLAGVRLGGRRFEQMGIGTRDDMANIASWGVPAGIIGARIYHVITDWELFRDDPIRMFKIWQGGLGIWGGVALGTLVGAWRIRVRMGPVGPALNALAPCLPLAQAIGRAGNWWNQELFGRPTTLPWALEINPVNRPAGYENNATFHPTFLYEALWNLGLCLALIWIGRRFRIRPFRLFVMYIAGYTFARFFIERIRIDHANTLGGLRVNEWVSIVVFSTAVLFLLLDLARPEPKTIETSGTAALTSAAVPARITPDDVAHVAKLARLDLSPVELVVFTGQLASMLEHFADVDALDLSDVEPMTQPYPLVNVLRDDVIKPSIDREELLASAPEVESHRFKVPSILGDAP